MQPGSASQHMKERTLAELRSYPVDLLLELEQRMDAARYPERHRLIVEEIAARGAERLAASPPAATLPSPLPHPSAWTLAPVPYELRERSPERLLLEAARLLRARAAILCAPLVFLLLLLQPLGLLVERLSGLPPGQLGGLVIELGLLMADLVAGPAIALIVHRACTGRQATIGEIVKSAARVTIPMLWTLLLGDIAVLAGLCLLVVPGLVLAAAFMLGVPVVALEGLSGPRALSRSYELMKGHLFLGFSLLLVSALLIGIFAFVSFVALGGIPLIGGLSVMGAVAATLVYQQVLTTLFYLDMRLRAEPVAKSAVRVS